MLSLHHAGSALFVSYELGIGCTNEQPCPSTVAYTVRCPESIAQPVPIHHILPVGDADACADPSSDTNAFPVADVRALRDSELLAHPVSEPYADFNSVDTCAVGGSDERSEFAPDDYADFISDESAFDAPVTITHRNAGADPSSDVRPHASPVALSDADTVGGPDHDAVPVPNLRSDADSVVVSDSPSLAPAIYLAAPDAHAVACTHTTPQRRTDGRANPCADTSSDGVADLKPNAVADASSVRLPLANTATVTTAIAASDDVAEPVANANPDAGTERLPAPDAATYRGAEPSTDAETDVLSDSHPNDGPLL